MNLLLAIEASQPDGTVYRMLLEWNFLSLASWFAAIARLF
jgi:hypothetical protein